MKPALYAVPQVFEREMTADQPKSRGGLLRDLFLAAEEYNGIMLDLDEHWHCHILHAGMVDDYGIDSLLGDVLVERGIEARDVLQAVGVRRDAAPKRRIHDDYDRALFHPVGVAFALIQLRRLGFDFQIDDFVLDVAREFPAGALCDQNMHAEVWAYANRERRSGPLSIHATECVGTVSEAQSEAITLANRGCLLLERDAEGRCVRLKSTPSPAASVRIGEPQPRYRSAQREARAEPQVEKALRPLHQKRKARTVARKREMAARASA